MEGSKKEKLLHPPTNTRVLITNGGEKSEVEEKSEEAEREQALGGEEKRHGPDFCLFRL